MKNRGFWEVLGGIRALYTSKNGHSYIRLAFRELHSEKNVLKKYTEFINFISFLRKKAIVFIRGDISKLPARRVNNSKYQHKQY